jgi:hypothetical protein
MLNVKRDLIGKTITGVIAVPGESELANEARGGSPCEIWLMQFSDGSYVEFVSPGARRGLSRSAARSGRYGRVAQADPQLALNVA